MIDTQLRGLGTALVTPFNSKGLIDYKALERLIERQIEAGVDYLVVLGTTSEAATIDDLDQMALKQSIIKQVDGRVPLVLGLGGNNTANVLLQLHYLSYALDKNNQNHYKAILSVCPYYNKPTQKGLYKHFCAIAESSPLPVILYNVPSRTGVNLLPETVMKIYNAYPDKIAGVKEASGDIKQINRLIKLAKGKFLVISGDDQLAAQLMLNGADGLISVASNAFPKEFMQIVHNKDTELQQQFSHFTELLFREGNPVGIKAALAAQKLITNQLKLPLVKASKQLQEEIQQELSKLTTD